MQILQLHFLERFHVHCGDFIQTDFVDILGIFLQSFLSKVNFFLELRCRQAVHYKEKDSSSLTTQTSPARSELSLSEINGRPENLKQKSYI